MFRTALTATALAALLAAGAQAQTAQTEPATPPAATAPMTQGAMPGHDAAADAEAGWTAAALGAVSADKLKGADLVNFQNEKIATIEDVLITNENTVDGIVVTFGGVLGFGAQRVLLAPDEVEVMQDADENLQVRTSLTPQAIEARPAYEDS